MRLRVMLPLGGKKRQDRDTTSVLTTALSTFAGEEKQSQDYFETIGG